MFGLRPGDRVFIESPTVYWLGEIEEIGVTYLALKPGAFEIRTLNNLFTFLADGKFHGDDEATPCPGRIRVPALSVVNVHDWTHPALPKCNRTTAQMRGT